MGFDPCNQGMAYLGEFEQLILFSLLHLGNGAVAFSIREVIKERTGLAVTYDAIYPALGRLGDGGLVVSRAVQPDDRWPANSSRGFEI